MNPMHVHLIFNHVPVIFVPLGLVFFQWGVWARISSLKLVGLTLFIAAAASGLIVFVSGTAAEPLVRTIFQAPAYLLAGHEAAAEVALAAVVALGAAAVWILFRMANSVESSSRVSSAIGILALVAALLLTRAAFFGGQIRHSELQQGWKDYRGNGSLAK